MDTTILIKTFERPSAVKRLIESIRKFYSDIPIVVVDDSKEILMFNQDKDTSYLKTEFDIGLSEGRNLGVDSIQTKYFFTCDDDNIFTPNTNLEKAEQLIELNNLDLLGVKEEGNDYYGLFEDSGDGVVKYVRGNIGTNGEVHFYDFVPNLFLMKTESAKRFRWDDELKIGEHFAYFHAHRGKLKVGFTDSIVLAHDHIQSEFYSPFRQRAEDYVKQYMKKAGIKRRIDLVGNIIEI